MLGLVLWFGHNKVSTDIDLSMVMYYLVQQTSLFYEKQECRPSRSGMCEITFYVQPLSQSHTFELLLFLLLCNIESDFYKFSKGSETKQMFKKSQSQSSMLLLQNWVGKIFVLFMDFSYHCPHFTGPTPWTCQGHILLLIFLSLYSDFLFLTRFNINSMNKVCDSEDHTACHLLRVILYSKSTILSLLHIAICGWYNGQMHATNIKMGRDIEKLFCGTKANKTKKLCNILKTFQRL